MYDTFIKASKEKKLKEAVNQLNAMTPAPMNTMLEKQSKEEAVAVWKKRKSMVVQEVPGTAGMFGSITMDRSLWQKYSLLFGFKEWM